MKRRRRELVCMSVQISVPTSRVLDPWSSVTVFHFMFLTVQC